MNHTDPTRQRLLQSYERRVEFDADDAAEKIIAARARRQRRKLVVGVSLASAGLILFALLRDDRPTGLASTADTGLHRVNVVAPSDVDSGTSVNLPSQTLDTDRSEAPNLIDRAGQLDEVLELFERVSAAIERERLEQQRDLFLVYRARESKKLSIHEVLDKEYMQKTIRTLDRR